jgi:xanthine dehydrogenase YagS FAD-binding subunit
MHNFAFSRATSPADALARHAATPNATFIAGGTNLVDRMKSAIEAPAAVVDISRLEFRNIERLPGGSWRIGGLATNTAVADHPELRKEYPLLARAILSGASQQIRNVATVGGNLLQRTRCSYFTDPAFACNKRVPGSGCPAMTGFQRSHAIFGASDSCIAVHPSDMCVALAALDATVEVLGPKGERKIGFDEFHRLPGASPDRDTLLEPGEIITGVVLPPMPGAKTGVYLKLRDRASYSFALVSVASVLEISGGKIRAARVALGGVAHKPWRAGDAEKFLVGKSPTEAVFKQAADLAVRDAKPLPGNAFKVELARRAVKRGLTVSAAGGGVA